MSQFLVVGIGASAGGIKALEVFFQHVPENSGIAYVVILHLSPNHDSKLAEVLEAVTSMPVIKVTDKIPVAPNTVYVIPPNQHLTMQDGFVDVSPNMVIEDRRAPVDIFFRSLAESHKAQAVCVVLSGTGANGSMGLKRVKERGGVAFVQNPKEAEYNEMPRNAIATDLVDEVLNVADIPAKIISYRDSFGTVNLPVEIERRPETVQQSLREIFIQLRLRTGHDFSNYKRPTLLRRIERRMNIRNLPDLPAYATYIQENPAEATALLKDLLISVTNFFRDKKGFEELESGVMPSLLQGKTSEDRLRIWVAGCATGEEAYSIAMLCAEQTVGIVDAPKVQIFATDIDEDAIATAREGYYSINDAADVPVQRLQRFFNKEGDGYRIRREIREMILFAQHNFLKDPPFSHLDLVTCRNVLIYLNQTAQERVMNLFHFALEPGGYLFLGNAESIAGSSDRFTTFSREQHIYQSRQIAARTYPIPESVPAFRIGHPHHVPAVPDIHVGNTERITFGDLHQRMLEQYAPPSLVVNEEYDILHISEQAGRYLQMPGGSLSQNLLSLIRQELRLELRSALYQATQRQIAVDAPGLRVNINDRPEIINILVRPVLKEGDVAKGLILVIFEPATEPSVKHEVALTSDEPVTKHLEEELIRLKAQLRSSSEQHEFQTEELKASNEELQAMIEELRSAAEELETSKEELQSINEELTTVNQELKVKVEESSITSNNLQNLINSADIGTIFLDRSFRIMLFTPAARSIFNLIPTDRGRLLSDITNRLEDDGLINDAVQVLEKLITIERVMRTVDNRTFVMRLSPYRTEEDRIRGVVIAFIDLTERALADEALRTSEQRMHVTMESATDYAIMTTSTEGLIEAWSQGAERIFGYTSKEAMGQPSSIIFTPEDVSAGAPEQEMRIAREEGRAPDERWHIRKDGSRFYMSGVMRPILNPLLTGYVKVARDMTEQKQSEEALRISEERYRIALQSAMMGAWDWNIPEDRIRWNDQHYTLVGLPPENRELNAGFFLQFVHPDDRDALAQALQEGIDRTGIFEMNEFRIVRADGEVCWMSGYGRVVDWVEGVAARMVGVMYDVSNRVKAVQELQDKQIKLDIAQRAARVGIWTYDLVKHQGVATPELIDLIGYPNLGETWELDIFLSLVHPEDRDQLIAMHQQAAQQQSGIELEFRLLHPQRGLQWLLMRGLYIPAYDQVNASLMGSIIDITERKMFEQQKDEFIGIASHELRTPVTSIKAYAEVLQEIFTENGDTENAALMNKLELQIDRLTGLIHALLDTTRVTEGQLLLQRDVFVFDDLLADVVEIMQRTTETHTLSFVANDEHCELVADRERIRQVLINLISNAIKYSPAADKVIIESFKEGDQLRVSVEDFGIGIPKEVRPKVFDRFFRASDPTIATFPGIGLGLYISAEIIRLHKGTIWVDSAPGKGSRFCFAIPIEH